MPKQLVEIRGFHNGIVCAPSETDIPLDAATYSLNVDPMAEDGKLCGIPEDSTVIASFTGTQMEWIKESGSGTERTLIYHDPTNSKIACYQDFEGAQTQVDVIDPFTADNDTVCMVQNGHEVHMGCGPTKDPKWVGYLQHGQFGSTPDTSTLYATGAALGTIGHDVNGIYKTDYYSSGASFIGMEYGGTKLVYMTAGVVVHTSDVDNVTFTRLQALCHSETGDGYVWVYDNDGTAYGTLYEIRYTAGAFSIIKTCPVSGWGGYGLEEPDNYTCTDMIQGKGAQKDVWFSMHHLGGGVKVVDNRSSDPADVRPLDADLSAGYPTLIFKTAGTPAAGAVATTNMSPMLSATDETSAVGGRFRLSDTVDPSYHYFNLVTFQKPFINLASNSDDIGWFCTFKDGTSSARINTSNAADWYYVGLSLYMIASTATAGSTAYPNGQAGVDFRGVKLQGDTSTVGVTSFYGKSLWNFQAALIKELAPGTDYFVVIGAGKASGVNLYSFGDSELAFTTSNNFPGSNIRYLEDDAAHEYQVDSVGVNLAKITISQGYQGTIPMFMESGGFAMAVAVLENGGTLANTVTYVTASDFIVAPRDTSVAAEGMRSDRTYRYFAALEYDGFQVGPMSEVLCEHKPSEDGKAIFVDFYLLDDVITDSRISGIIVLRSFYEGLVSTQEDSLPRVIGKIDLTTLTATKRIEGFATDYYYYTVKDTNSPAETFQELAGYPHDESICTPRFGLSCKGGGQQFVTNCGGVTGIDDASNYGFISEVGRLDQFDLFNKFVVFSERPNAIAYWRGRFYAFANAKFWRINPSGPYIEDEYDGIGCQGPKCVLANEYGLFVAGTNNIYLDEGQGLVPIGFPILTSGVGIGWNERLLTTVPTVSFDMKKKCFLVSFGRYLAGRSYVWAYSLAKRRWDLWEGPSRYKLYDYVIGSGGELYFTDAHTLYELGSEATYKNVAWYSRVIDCGANTIDKKFYKIRMPHQNATTGVAIAAEDQDGNSLTLTNVDETQMIVREFPNSRERGVRIKIDDLPGDCKVDSIGLIYRPFVGVR